MRVPPVLAGAVQRTTAEALPALGAPMVGAPGRVRGVTAALISPAGTVPAMLRAVAEVGSAIGTVTVSKTWLLWTAAAVASAATWGPATTTSRRFSWAAVLPPASVGGGVT